MSRSVALSPQFGSAVTFGSGTVGRRRRAKSVHVPVPDGLRVIAVCVPEDVVETAGQRAGRPAPHRTPVAARRSPAASMRSPSARRAGPRTTGGDVAADTLPSAGAERIAQPRGPMVGSRSAGARRVADGVRPVAVARPAAPPTTSRSAPLRLTRRGQIVLTLIVTGLLLAVFSLGRFSAGAAGNPVPHRTVVVHSGDTLWSIAAQASPSADPRVTVEKIRVLNHLDGGGVESGQQLQLP